MRGHKEARAVVMSRKYINIRSYIMAKRYAVRVTHARHRHNVAACLTPTSARNGAAAEAAILRLGRRRRQPNISRLSI